MSENNRGVKLEKLIDGKKEQIYPITKTKCVFDDNGDSLDDRISKIKSEPEGKDMKLYDFKRKHTKYIQYVNVLCGVAIGLVIVFWTLLLAFYVRNENRTKMEEAKK